MHYQTHAHTVHPRPPLVNRTNTVEVERNGVIIINLLPVGSNKNPV